MDAKTMEAIKEHVTDRLMEISENEHPRDKIRGSVDLYVRLLNEATEAICPPQPPREMTLDEMIAHDSSVGIPGWKRVD